MVVRILVEDEECVIVLEMLGGVFESVMSDYLFKVGFVFLY